MGVVGNSYLTFTAVIDAREADNAAGLYRQIREHPETTQQWKMLYGDQTVGDVQRGKQRTRAKRRIPDMSWNEFKVWYAKKYGPVGDEEL